MKVIARYHHSIEPEIEAWVQSQPGTDPERRKLAKQNLALFRKLIQDTCGEIPDAVRCKNIDPARQSPLVRRQQELVCDCGVRFPVKQGLPILIAEQAELPAGCARPESLPCRKKKK